MLKEIHTERFNIGYDGINPIDEIIEHTKILSDKFDNFFYELDEEHYLSLRQEIVPEHKTTLYYLEVKMPELLAPTFVLYFGTELLQTYH
ncbi:hypothetical protein NVP2275O_374 [Vibrio phage 2.275.O._10N.286.54.E11]|nr:hypothetical protein NVP2275O_374 [Vibrio phage 2.275.O._10N.286.54.E11]